MTVTLSDSAHTTIERWGTSGPVILCVHGMTGSRLSWLRLAKQYQDRYQFIAYDQRGHGDSAEVAGMALSRGIQDALDVAATVGTVDALMGHSWGGAVVLGAGEKLDVRGVVSIDPMIVQAPQEWYAEYIDELDAQFTAAGDNREAAIRKAYAGRHEDDLAGSVLGMSRMTTKPIAGLRDENPDGSWDFRDAIRHYRKPLFLALADYEESIVPRDVIADLEQSHSSNVSIEIFDGLGHSLHRDGFERFTKSLDRFLGRVLSS